MLSKLASYGRAAIALRSLNLLGLPGIPKRTFDLLPNNRELFNEFVCYIDRLRLGSVNTVFDIGANHGDFGLAASALFPAATVVLVEPIPWLVEKMKGKASRHDLRWNVIEAAIGASAGRDVLTIDTSNDAIGSLVGFSEEYRVANPDAAGTQQIEVTVTTFEELTAQRSDPTIDLVKIDVEGFEFEVLKGGRDAWQYVRSVIVEVSLVRRTIDDRNALVAMLDELATKGFEIVDIIPSYFAANAPWRPVEFNILARRS